MTNKPMLSVEREHRLKIHRKPFLDLESGAKTCEIRDCSDRDFQVNDSVVLMLLDETGNPTTKELHRKITHIQTGYGLQDHLCVLSYAPATQHQGEPVAEVERAEGDLPHVQLYQDLPDGTKLYAEQPAPVAVVMPELSGEELEFLKSVHAYCGSKLHSCFGEDGSALWPRLEEIGLIKCLGSYKWELTFDAVAMGIKARLNGVKPLSSAAPKIEFVACTAYNMGGDGYAEQTQTCCGSCPGGCVAGLNAVKP